MNSEKGVARDIRFCKLRLNQMHHNIKQFLSFSEFFSSCGSHHRIIQKIYCTYGSWSAYEEKGFSAANEFWRDRNMHTQWTSHFSCGRICYYCLPVRRTRGLCPKLPSWSPTRLTPHEGVILIPALMLGSEAAEEKPGHLPPIIPQALKTLKPWPLHPSAWIWVWGKLCVSATSI